VDQSEFYCLNRR